MTAAVIAFFSLAACFVAGANLLYFRILAQVNQQLPPDRRLSFMVMYPGKGMRVAREHRRLYPESKLRLTSNLMFAAALVFFLLALWRLGFFT